MTALSTWVPEDGVLGAVAPLGLAAARRTALVLDLDPAGPRYPGALSLALLVERGPRRIELQPERRGTAVLTNGGVEPDDAADVVVALVAGWPDVVVRLPAGRRDLAARFDLPVVPFRPLLPASPTGGAAEPSVWQSAGWRVRPHGPGPVLPRPAASTVGALLGGVRPPRSRWLRALQGVWELPWR